MTLSSPGFEPQICSGESAIRHHSLSHWASDKIKHLEKRLVWQQRIGVLGSPHTLTFVSLAKALCLLYSPSADEFLENDNIRVMDWPTRSKSLSFIQ
ncbi:hypothetical protein TNCV_2845661 [Trichonephila clavipes]|nr:hypothetical protein TNCV_2845661 [Trichonephila clavipes]